MNDKHMAPHVRTWTQAVAGRNWQPSVAVATAVRALPAGASRDGLVLLLPSTVAFL